MTDKIIFPLDSESCLRKGRIFFEAGNEKEALKYIGKAYTLDNKIEINIFYAAVLVHYQLYPEALEIMQCEKHFYKDNEDYAPFYTEVLIKNRHFLAATNIIQKYKDNLSKINTLAWEMLEQDLSVNARLDSAVIA